MFFAINSDNDRIENNCGGIPAGSVRFAVFGFDFVGLRIKFDVNANMTNVFLSRMFRGKMRTNTCRIIVLTSIVWLLIDVVLLLHYADFFGVANGDTAKRTGEYDVEVIY